MDINIITEDVPSIEDTLEERGGKYGDFRDVSNTAQNLKRVFVNSKNWCLLSYAHRESLEMIANKMGRILNGDVNYKDSWIDIAGYATLAANTCEDNHE